MALNRTVGWWAGVAFGLLMTPVLYAGVLIFADGFEIGSTQRWETTGPAPPRADVLTLSSVDFVGRLNTVGYINESTDANGALYVSGGTIIEDAVAGVKLPQGALVTQLEMEVKDTSDVKEFRLRLDRCPVGEILTATGFCETLATIGSGASFKLVGDGTGQPTVFTSPLATAQSIDNFQYVYFVRLEERAGGFRSLRIHYQSY